MAPRSSLSAGVAAEIEAGLALADPAASAGQWALMLAAMMLPLLAPMAGYVAGRSFPERRDRAIALFLLGYAAVWSGCAVLSSLGLLVASAVLNASGLSAAAGLIGCALAALWQLSPMKVRALNRCHGVAPLRAFGGAADQDALTFGIRHGGRCIRSCFAPMVLPLLGGHGLPLMLGVSLLLWSERLQPQPPLKLSAAALLMLGFSTLPWPPG